MNHEHIIHRTEKVRELKKLLARHRIIYLSSFFYSGKSVLLDQLDSSLSGKVLRFDAGTDDMSIFLKEGKASPDATLLIESVQSLTDPKWTDALSAMLSNLLPGQRAVLAGRGQNPAWLQRLLSEGVAVRLDKDFVMLTGEETDQLFQGYDIRLSPPDLHFMQEAFWGYAFVLHIAARRRMEDPSASLRALKEEIRAELQQVFSHDVLLAFPEQERSLLYCLSPFSSFTAQLARMITGRTDAPRIMEEITFKSYMLLRKTQEEYAFVPFVQEALLREMKNTLSEDYIDGLYRRAALYYELQNQIPIAIRYYMQLQDKEKIRELLIRDTYNRPANGDYVDLRFAYALLSEKAILDSPELMKGMSLIESMQGRAEEGERWYQELTAFMQRTPIRDARRKTAAEAIAYLDICLPQRGTKATLRTLLRTVQAGSLTQSALWQKGFNIAGNSASLLNGGLDFCRWVPAGPKIYRLFRTPVELALGKGSGGLADLALGECELETNLCGEYRSALDHVCSGLAKITDNTEMRCAAIGIQSRILAACGNIQEAVQMLDHLLASLAEDVPPRLRRNMCAQRYLFLLMSGSSEEAISWLNTSAPDETGEFLILDRYEYMMKLRLYVITEKWSRTQLLCAKLRHYFDSYDRPYMRIQLHLIQAVIDRRTGQGGWEGEMRSALALAEKYHLVRVIADEGIAILDMLTHVCSGGSAWEEGVLRLTKAQAAACPAYLKAIASRPVFTDREYQVYTLLLSGYKNAKIASVLNISERTVKHYTAEIYRKLHVTTRAEAMNLAAELGDIR